MMQEQTDIHLNLLVNNTSALADQFPPRMCSILSHFFSVISALFFLLLANPPNDQTQSHIAHNQMLEHLSQIIHSLPIDSDIFSQIIQTFS